MIKYFNSVILSIVLALDNNYTNSIENASITGKNELIYEITNFYLSENQLCIEGWAFNSESQHFLDESTHEIWIELKCPNESHLYKTQLKNIDQSELMNYQGARTCQVDEYFKTASICNYEYKNVGFEAKINLNELNLDQIYVASLIVDGKSCGRTTKIPIYCPMSTDFIAEHSGSRIRIHSSLDDTRIIVNADTVFAREAPYKSAPVHKKGNSCSVTYGNTLFFKKDTGFESVFEKVFFNNTSYYRVSGNLDACFKDRRRIKEGTEIENIWIASPFVDYSGSMMQIIIEAINHAPQIIGDEIIEIELYTEFRLLDHVSAYDQEDGIISELIHITTGEVNSGQIGNYELILKVTDSQGASDEKKIQVIVKEPENYQPVIEAEDLILSQYDEYDPIQYVKAIDHEDGDLNNAITYTTNVDTDFIGRYQTEYQVIDSQGSIAEKKITVDVTENENLDQYIRYIDPDTYPFNNKSLNWKKHIDKLKEECDRTDAYYSLELN